MKRIVMLVLAGLCLLGCQQTVSLEAPGEDRGLGNLNDFNIEKNVRVALYQASDVKEGKEPPELTYGSMDAQFVTLDNVIYMVDWNDQEDFKNLKKGEKLHFRATGYLAKVEGATQNYRVVKLNEM
ncbi:MAG: hypothetical protein ACO1RX_15765 [Candidatus Sericytochromatia bacterium]